MTTRRQCKRSAGNSHRRLRGAKAARFSQAVQRFGCPTSRAFGLVAQVRACPRDSRLSGDDNLTPQRAYLDPYIASIDLQVHRRTAREFTADLRERLKQPAAATRLAPIEIG